MPQLAVLEVLRTQHAISFSPKQLRAVAASLAASLNRHRHQAQVCRLHEWMEKAEHSKGPHKPMLAVGRDGIHVPMKTGKYNEAAVATLSVFDRQGRRLGTVYLGQMPEEQQSTLSEQLTRLIEAVLRGCKGEYPRLAYITDGGWHPTDYYRRVLRQMVDPRQADKRLVWERVIDFYHAAEYITKLALALFGEGMWAQAWAKQMRQRIKEPHGVTGVLQSASYHRSQRKLSAKAQEEFRKAHAYLQRNRRFMDYARYRQEAIPLGSGITEAACKTVVTQRLKLSGMQWGIEGGQVILDLRVLCLSGIWDRVFQTHLQDQSDRLGDTIPGFDSRYQRRAA